MAGPMVSQTLGALGAMGMNSQASSIDLPPQFATLALNCYADEEGRPTARKSAIKITTDNSSVADSDQVRRVFRHNLADGTSALVSSTTGYIVSGTTTFTVRHTNASDGNYQFASLNGKIFAACAGEDFKVFDEVTWAAATIAVPAQPIAIHAAYGRLWALSQNTLYWSVLLDGTDFAGAGSGSVDLRKIHTSFKDNAVAVVGYNKQIAVLCRNSIFILGMAVSSSAGNPQPNPSDATTPIFLNDVIPNVGCYARDTVVTAGDDVLFVSDDGVRSLARSMQEKQGPSPLSDLSSHNKDYAIVNLVKGNATTALTACWHPEKSWYMVFAETTKEVWLFDLGRRIPQLNVPRMFIWRMGATRTLFHGTFHSDKVMYFGGLGGLYNMESFDVTDLYSMSVTSGWLSLGGPERLDTFKRALVSLTGGSGQAAYLKWYVDFLPTSERTIAFTLDDGQEVYEYNVDEYEVAEYGGGASVTAEVYLNLAGAGKVIQFTLELPVQGFRITLNNLIAFYKQGRVR